MSSSKKAPAKKARLAKINENKVQKKKNPFSLSINLTE